MVKIVHYEVYADSGNGWQLEERFSSDQRYEAVNLAKELEQDHYKVKIIKEYFDVQDNSYQETVEYVSGFAGRRSVSGGKNYPYGTVDEVSPASVGDINEGQGKSELVNAIVKIITIIIMCLVLANLMVTLLLPIIETFFENKKVNTITFVIFLTVFLGSALPLLLKKVPWYVFSQQSILRQKPQENKFYDRANLIEKRYNINDRYDPQVAPVYPEAAFEYKMYIVNFLRDVISNVNSATSLQDDFSKLGIKLIIFGGCFELARYSGLNLPEANSLLYEAYKFLDGDDVDLEAFYEAKKTYKDNRCAVFLSGVGAYLMKQVIDEHPMDINILKIAFDKWEEQNYQISLEKAKNNTELDKDINFYCIVNIKNTITYVDDTNVDKEKMSKQLRAAVVGITDNILDKYRAVSVNEKGEVTTLIFNKLNRAVKFATNFLNDIASYADDITDENTQLHCCCNIIEDIRQNELNIDDYAADLFEQTYDYEIITTEEINKMRDELDATRYSFDFLGEKKLNRTHLTERLYKILY